MREVREETGVSGRAWWRRCPASTTPSIEGGVRIHKRVDYFLLAYDGSERDFDPREVVAARWFPWEEALARLSLRQRARGRSAPASA